MVREKYPPGAARPAKEARSKIVDRTSEPGELNSELEPMRGRRSTVCVDCGVCTIALGEDYMVGDETWEQAGENTFFLVASTAATAVERLRQHGIFGHF